MFGAQDIGEQRTKIIFLLKFYITFIGHLIVVLPDSWDLLESLGESLAAFCLVHHKKMNRIG